jgi:hypothetical protein
LEVSIVVPPPYLGGTFRKRRKCRIAQAKLPSLDSAPKKGEKPVPNQFHGAILSMFMAIPPFPV